MYDTLRAVTTGSQSATAITSCWQNSGENGEKMLHFMENHDEQRIASDFFAGNGIKGRPAMVISACIDKCPIMYYAGQELGEKGMDKEGYSGVDGRTTIFDYWSVDTLRRWKGDGSYSGELLTEDEKNLQAFYSNLLNLCNSNDALREGMFYGLQYANPHSDKYDSNHIFSYLRGTDKELLLIVTNFSDCDKDCDITIPEEAFAFYGISYNDKVIKAKELLYGNGTEQHLNAYDAVSITVPANSGVIIKFNI